MLNKFSAQCFSHNCFLCGFPVLAKGLFATTSQSRRYHRRLRASNFFFIFVVGELLCLEVMFGGRPGSPFYFNWMRRKVGKLTVWLPYPIKWDFAHFPNSAMSSIFPMIFRFISANSSDGIHSSWCTDAPTVLIGYRSTKLLLIAKRRT